MEVASASSSTKPQVPEEIFLSHSGKQKGKFVTHLFHALRRANRQPFFDIDYADSLPAGLDYPPRIFQACHDCTLAVVVLSEDYVTSLWPMVELQHLLRRPKRLIYPLFYKLKPGDLSDPCKLKSWQACWEQYKKDWHIQMQKLQEHMSSKGSELQINLDIESWPDNLSELKWRSGSVRHVIHADHERRFYASDHEYIEEIVSNINLSLPPPQEYPLDGCIMGQERMQQEIGKVFQQEGSIGGDEVGAIGVYGIGGIGKSTLCKMMVNFYRSEFPGRCFYLELPSNGHDVLEILLKAIRYPVEDVTNVDQAMGVLNKRLQSKKFFLAIDNIWGHPHESYEHAERIMLMKFQPGTKIMLSSRGKGILRSLLEKRAANAQSHPSVVHVPCLTEAEAVESLKSRIASIPQDFLCGLALSCFFEGQCHPLCLKEKVRELEQMNQQYCRELISSLKVCGGASAQEDSNSATHTFNDSEESVLRTVEESLEAVSPRLQDIFIDLATTWPAWCLRRLGLPNFVRYHYDGYTEQHMRCDVLSKLEHHGLMDVEPDPNYCEGTDGDPDKIVIHNLLKLMAKRRPASLHVNSVAKDAIIGADLSVVTSTNDQLLGKKHVSGWNLRASTWRALFESSTMPNPVKVKIRGLFITSAALPWRIRLHLKKIGIDVQALRVLHLQGIEELREIQGWEGVPDLMVLRLYDLDGLKRIGSIGCLRKLERLALVRCRGLAVQALVGAGARVSLVKPGDKLPMLQHLIVEESWHLTEVGPRLFDAFPALKVLALRGCRKLESFPDLNSGELRTLDLDGCQNLKSIEGISDSSLTALQRLLLAGCSNLTRISHIGKVRSTDLLELYATACPSELGSQLRLMMVGSCCSQYNRLRVLRLPICIPTEKYSMKGTDEVGDGEIDHEFSGSSSFPAALRLRDAVFSSDNCKILNEVMAHFVHLQRLHISAKLEAEYPCWLDVSGLPRNLKELTLQGGFESEYPCWLEVSGLPNLERLDLQDFTSVKKLVISSSLVNQTFLNVENFRALREISGLGAHHAQLAELCIQRCPLMEKFLDAHAQLPGLRTLLLKEYSKWLAELPNLAAIAPSLEELSLLQCTSLTDVPGLAGLTNELTMSTALERIPNLRHLGALKRLTITCPGSCWELRRQEDLQEMASDGVTARDHESRPVPAPRHGEAGAGCCGFFLWFTRSFIRLVFGV